jgi:hypothetical protein
MSSSQQWSVPLRIDFDTCTLVGFIQRRPPVPRCTPSLHHICTIMACRVRAILPPCIAPTLHVFLPTQVFSPPTAVTLKRDRLTHSEICRMSSDKAHSCVSKSFRTGLLERELRMVQLSATRCSCIAILWVSLVNFAAITLCVACERVFIFVSVYFVIDSVRKLLDTPSYDVNEKLKKLSLCLIKHHAMKTWGSGGIAPRFLNLGARLRRVVSFALLPLYPGKHWIEGFLYSNSSRRFSYGENCTMTTTYITSLCDIRGLSKSFRTESITK